MESLRNLRQRPGLGLALLGGAHGLRRVRRASLDVFREFQQPAMGYGPQAINAEELFPIYLFLFRVWELQWRHHQRPVLLTFGL